MKQLLYLMHDTSGRLNRIKESFIYIEQHMTQEQKEDKEFSFNVRFGKQKARELQEVLDNFYIENKETTRL